MLEKKVTQLEKKTLNERKFVKSQNKLVTILLVLPMDSDIPSFLSITSNKF